MHGRLTACPSGRASAGLFLDDVSLHRCRAITGQCLFRAQAAGHAVKRMLLIAIVLVATAPTALAEYRYALIINADDNSDLGPTIEALQQHGFHCTQADWKSDRDLRSGVSGFMSRTATNSTALILYSGKVSIVESKSKEHRGQKSLGIHWNGGAAAYPVVDVIHSMNTVGGSSANIVFLDTTDSVDDPQPTVPHGFSVLSGHATNLIESLKANGVLTAESSTALSPPEQFVTGGKLGDEWVNRRGMTFRWCPAGSFTDSSGQQVTIEDGFWLMKFEWTRGQIMGKGDLRRSPGNHKLQALGKFGIRELPGALRRYNADERKAGRLPDDYEYALPTEAQWEYAARAGSTTSYCFGNDPAQLPSYGNFADKSYYDTGSIYSNYGHRTFDDGQPSVAMVGQYKPNAWGFYDMHGNVSEFCENGISRGGSWISTVDSCRFDFRDPRWGHDVGEYQGYRFVIRKVDPVQGGKGKSK